MNASNQTTKQSPTRTTRPGNRDWRCVLPLLGALLLVTPTAPAMQEKTLPVRQVVWVTGTNVSLGDLVDNAAALPEGWAQRPVFAAPAPGKCQQFSLTAVAYALQKYTDMSDFSLRGATRVAVHRQGRYIEQDELRNAVRSYLATNADWVACAPQVEFDDISDTPMVPAGTIEARVSGFEFNANTGKYRFNIEVVTSDAVHTLKLSAKLFVKTAVWMAARPIPPGKLIEEDDVRGETIMTELNQNKNIFASESILGYEASRSIMTGEPVSRTVLRQPVCTERGGLVEVTARRNGLEIVIRVKALTKGRRGDKVVCVNEESRRQIVAELVSPGKGNLAGT